MFVNKIGKVDKEISIMYDINVSAWPGKLSLSSETIDVGSSAISSALAINAPPIALKVKGID